MKKLIILIAILAFAYKYFSFGQDYPEKLDVVGKQKTVSYVKYMAKDIELHQLAVPNEVTIIEVYAPSCPACKQFDRNYKYMEKFRPDVNLLKLNVTDDFLRGGLSEKIKESLKQNDICYTPHIAIVNAMGEVVAKDGCSSKAGSKFYIKWLNKELKLSTA